MSRLTGNDAKSLMEAYSAIYAPQELTEEQVWEEVENWVNSLLEEDYDLSEYTWEEMYESYLNEAGMDVFSAIRSAQQKPSSIFTKPTQKAPPLGQPGSGFQNTRPVLGMPTPSLTLPPNRVGPGLVGNQVSGPATISNLYTNGTSSTNRTSTRPAAPVARPAAPVARPAAPVAASPRSAAASAGGNALAQTTAAALKPAAFSPKPQSDVAGMIARSQERQSAQTSKPAVSTSTTKPTPRQARLNMSFDLFDTIKGHLLDEGYADSEEKALAIMAHMSDEWKQSIVEGRVESETMSSGERRLARNERYREENPTLPSGNPTGSNAQLMRQMSHAKKRGVKKKRD